MQNPALILIDVQEGFRDPSWGPRNNPAFEANLARLLAGWRRRGHALVHVRHDSTSATSPLRPGQPGNDFMTVARPAPGEPVVPKRVHAAFIGTDLMERLRALGVDGVVFAGLVTDHCVSTSARIASDSGLVTSVVSDATATFDRRTPDGATIPAEEIHRGALASLHQEFATVLTVDELLDVIGVNQ